MEEKEIKLGTGKTIVVIILALAILIVSQMLSMLIGNVPVMLGAPAAIGNVISGILYPFITFLGIKWLCKKILKASLEKCRITRFSVKPLWVVAAVIMPCIVSAVLLVTSGHWDNTAKSMLEIWKIVTGAVFFYGIGTGLVEEMIFRGVIMSALEYRCNKIVAITVPSVLFGLLHIIGNDLGFLDIIQLLVAGSIVGILFSLVTYESGNVWNGAIIHGVWNMIIIGGILHIGGAADEWSIYNYVLDTDSFWLTGGDFGIEASIVSVIAYLFFSVLAVVLMKKKK